MSVPKRAIGSAVFLCLCTILSNATEHLYTVGGDRSNTVYAYSVNPTTAATKLLGRTVTPAVHSIQVFRAPTAPFLYVLGYLMTRRSPPQSSAWQKV
jgi:hypothetical protein